MTGPVPDPYMDEEGVPQVRRSVVVFLDILGYQNLIREVEDKRKGLEFLPYLLDAFKRSMQYLRDDQPGNHQSRYQIRTLTDNIVLGYPIVEGQFEFGDICATLALFQLSMTCYGFFLRGAVAVGDLMVYSDLIYGGGLLEAHDGERKLARDPRIVLTGSAQRVLEEHLGKGALAKGAPEYDYLFRDADEQLFINYLHPVSSEPPEILPFRDCLQRHKTMIEKGLWKHRHKPLLWSKYAWAANYHNYFCEQEPSVDPALQIDLGQFRMRPNRLGQ